MFVGLDRGRPYQEAGGLIIGAPDPDHSLLQDAEISQVAGRADHQLGIIPPGILDDLQVGLQAPEDQ